MDQEDAILRQNRQAWDRLVTHGNRFTKVATEKAFANPLHAVDQAGWLGNSISGKSVLCLAAGGGRQGPLYAAAGAQVTVLDISEEMLRLDRTVAAARGLKMRVLQGSMDDLSVLGDQAFDIVIQPVSTCYVPDICQVYREVARVMVGGGIYISQHKSPVSLQASHRLKDGNYVLEHRYYDKSPLKPAEEQSTFRETGTMEFVHRWEEIIGGMCRSGFVIEDLVEPLYARKDPKPGGFADRCSVIAPYVRIKAKKLGTESGSRLILG